MKSPDTKPGYRGNDEGVPLRAYAVMLVFALGMLLAVLFQSPNSESKNTTHTPQTRSTQRADSLAGSPNPAPTDTTAAAPAPVELIVKKKIETLSTTRPTLEPPKQCYWLDKHAIPPRWLAVKAVYGTDLSKQSCFELDSCDGGQSKSRGDCYKWAASPNTERDPW